MTIIREATEGDVVKVRDLFARVYGESYPFPGFYDTAWLTKAVYDDDTLFLVAERDNEIVASGSAMLAAGGMSDLIAEIGRLVAEPSRRAAGAAQEMVTALIERLRDRVHFAFAETRTVHPGSQRLAETCGWTAIGFEPLKYLFARRESVAMYATLSAIARELRRNNPRVIPEAGVLAQTVLRDMQLPVDVIIEDEVEGYPFGREYRLERLQQQGMSPLLRIERGRVRNKEIFGNFSLSHGFFRIANSNSHYLVARDGEAFVGAVGFTHDPIDHKTRIFEMIDFSDDAKGFLLSAVDRIAREEMGAVYQEADVSAYAPRMQRTLERLGFVPVAYGPSMVFHDVERLDVLRMAKVSAAYDLGRLRLLPAAARVKEIVEKCMEDRFIGIEISEAARRADIFQGLPEGDLYHLGRIAALRQYPAGAQLIREGEAADMLYILVEGQAEARSGGRRLGAIPAGAIFGEMALVENTRRNADVFLIADSSVIEIEIPRLERLMERYPRLGHIVLRNIAASLSRKLRARGQ